MTVNNPAIMSAGFFCPPKIPKVSTANGLTTFIVNYIDWTGGHANRVSSAGRWIPGANKYDGGMFIPSTTKKGTADISAIIRGKSVQFEVKIGADRPSPAQLNEQKRVQQAGGLYFFVKTPEQFFEILDSIP